ncbi:MAG: 30S ribosomal protein S1 [Patescibacteria group bacterium]
MASMKELLKRNSEGLAPKQLRRGELVEGIVLRKGEEELLLDIGGKTEGLISGTDLDDNLNTFESVEVGDTVMAKVLQGRTDNGFAILSLKEASSEVKWQELRGAFDSGQKLEVEGVSYNKSGLVVQLSSDLEGFLPFSHLDRSHFPGGEEQSSEESSRVRILSSLVGETVTVKIIEFDPQNNRVVVSEKEALSEKYEDEREELWDSLESGKVIEGVVVGIVPFGLFVRLGDTDVEGLVHISEVSWEKIESLEDVYSIGDKVEVMVLSVNLSEERVSLSIKALKENPWEDIKEKYSVGDEVTGKVTRVAPFGAFVRLEDGIEGLVHISETDGPLDVGKEVEAKIISFEPDKQRLGLSVK